MRKIILLIFILILALQACKKETAPCVKEPIPQDYVEAKNEWMIRHNIGDTLIFNRYKVVTDSTSRKYIYTGQETFIANDTVTAKIPEPKPYGRDNCNFFLQRNTKILSFNSPEKFQIRLKPHESFDHLIIFFKEKHFEISNSQYNFPGRTYQKMRIENTDFYQVNHILGYDENSWGNPAAFIDSTYAFYNVDFGILKFIINDTLVYQRVIKQ